eukprot:TRINITY_DN865_c0_g2_i2.p1 TRINITY_DN865_c0_g2~~TRINITY_DN865_c0_g2_i2.p1  ORF type:complete len:1020 (-),score=142.24 TRINITY_DN865_c0_g2_i2:385-3444(-)
MLLVRLKDAMQKTEREIIRNGDIVDELFKLSLQAQKSIRLVLECIMFWGLVPNMCPGAGRPFARKPPQLDDISSMCPPVSQRSVHVLSICALSLAELCFEEELCMVIADSHLIDVLAAVIEIGYFPAHQSELGTHTVWKARNLLFNLVDERGLPTMNLTRAIIYLLTSTYSKQKALGVDLSWLRDVCCNLLAKILTGPRPDALHSLISIFVDQPNVEDVAFYKAAQLITSVPKNHDPDGYFAGLAPQLLGELRNRGSGTDNHVRAASIIIAVMLQRYPDHAFRHVILPMSSTFQPYISLCRANVKAFLDVRQGETKRDSSSNMLDVRSPSILTISRRTPSFAPQKKILIQEMDANVDHKSPDPTPALQVLRMRKPTAGADADAVAPTDAILVLLQPFDTLPIISDSVSSERISRAVADIHLLATHNPNPLLLEKLTPLIPALFEIMLAGSTSSMEDSVASEEHDVTASAMSFNEVALQAKEVLLLYLAFVPRSVAMRTLLYLIFENDKNWATTPTKAHFAFQPVGNAVALNRLLSLTQEDIFVRDALIESSAILDLLKSLSSAASTPTPAEGSASPMGSTQSVVTPDLLGDLFVQLLVEFVASHEDAGKSGAPTVRANERAMVALQVLLGMSDTLGENVLANVVQVCVFVQSMLKSDDEEILSLSLTILDMLTQSTSKVKISAVEVDVLLIDMLSPLKLLSLESNSDTIRAFADQLFTRIKHMIATNATNRASRQTDDEPLFNPSAQQSVEAPHAASVDDALADIASPIAPIRAGGLIQLRRFLLKQDKTAIARLPAVLKIFGENLANNDSYVYLGAIQGLSAVGDIALQQALPYIRQNYGNPALNLEVRLKIGEAILQVAQRLGDALPKYSDQIYGLLFPVLRDSDPTMRASALSNIAELGELLRYGIKPYIHEIMDVVYDIILGEREVEVRRAALNAVYQICHGLEHRIHDVIPEHLARLYKLLQSLSVADPDEVSRFLAATACEEIQEIVADRIQSTDNFLSGGDLAEKLRIVNKN